MTISLGRFDHLPRAGAARDPGILLIDDDPFILDIQARMLEVMGFHRIGTAGSGQAALSMMRSDPAAVDVIVCDLNMPHMDGIQFLQILNADGFKGGVILLSGEGARVLQTVHRLLERGRLVILGALEKPVGRDALRTLIAGWNSSRVQPTPASEEIVFTAEDLRSAHAQGQWVLHYQPKVNLGTGELASLEALVRWNHPSLGLVMPDRFIDRAETTGLIDAITDWVLGEALTQIVRWRKAGVQTRVAVNISALSLEMPGFANRVADIVRDVSMTPQDLILEITESRLISTSAVPLENLVRLRLRRFGLSIDDFGTGHSSLQQLRDVPYTELKIDRSFVRGARFNPITRPILEGSIEMAKRLGILSVAEGVECEEDWQLVLEVGCDLAQGYFIARPMAPEGLVAWLGTWNARYASLARR